MELINLCLLNEEDDLSSDVDIFDTNSVFEYICRKFNIQIIKIVSEGKKKIIEISENDTKYMKKVKVIFDGN